ncbi:MAG: Ig-like domain-containing protein [Acidobacteriota bacterium]|nr:MAG: Ig-like domain-containing protein [Acidobacteriota bacterium]
MLAWMLVAALAVGCDDVETPPLDAQKLVVGATPASICPDPLTGTGRATIVATAFGADGSLVEGIQVQFSSDRGSLDQQTVATNNLGQAVTFVRAPRTATGASVTVTAIHPNGASDDIEIAWPPNPELFARAFPDAVLPGSTIIVEFGPSNPCNLARLELRVRYNPRVVRFAGAVRGGPLELMGVSLEPTSTVLELDASQPGLVEVDYYQDQPDALGSSALGTYLTLSFDALEPGLVDFQIPSYTLWDNAGLPYSEAAVSPPFAAVVAP